MRVMAEPDCKLEPKESPVARRTMRARVLRWGSRVAGMVALTLVAFGVWGWFSGSRAVGVAAASPQLVVAPADAVLDGIAAGEKRIVTFLITNTSTDRAARVVGSEDFCDESGCVRTLALPRTIPPGAAVGLEVEYQCRAPAAFSKIVPIYTDCPGQFKLELAIESRTWAAL